MDAHLSPQPVSRKVAWHRLDIRQAAEQLDSDADAGLIDAARRQQQYGPNTIASASGRSLSRMLLDQFRDFMILVLLAAALISGVVGEPQDTIVILIIVLLNAIIGAVQEYRAEKTLQALHRLVAARARVIRAGQRQTVPASELVPGDLVLLEAGDKVPADLRLVAAADLQADEASLTGESNPVGKSTGPIAADNPPLGDRRNMLYKATLVTRGHGAGLVTATGMQTELGRIAALLETADSVQTPLQRRLARFGQRLAIAILVICAVVFVSGLLRDEPAVLMFLTAVSLAVAAIPEALPAVVTISLAFGARRMSLLQALMRRLPAVETLGSVTYVCSDKTGTLTRNRMRLELIHADNADTDHLSELPDALQQRLGQALCLSNDVAPGANGNPAGDPTEVALYQAAEINGFSRPALQGELPRIGELSFSSGRQRMTTLHRDGSGAVAFTKGAPEQVLPVCSEALTATGPGPVDADMLMQAAERLAAAGYRVLAVACRGFATPPPATEPDALEARMTFLGLVALIDPPRDEVPEAVRQCRSAGITPVMITGDHPGTARAIARRLGIIDDGDGVLTGPELEALSEAGFRDRVGHIRVYARVTPEQKLRIVRALQQRGEYVAMTGDGVNDAPALKQADIGVAMGRKGTDVAREAADMVLLDDNFATIVAAVREGRRIFDNIRKFIRYTMTSNAGEIWTLFLAPFLGLPIPLLPIQILWINLVTDGLPGLALAAEPKERGVMHRPPRPPHESIFAGGMWQHMVWVGLLIGGLSLGSQAWAISRGSDNWQTIVFTVLTFAQLAHVMVIRSERDSLFTVGLFSNPSVLGAVVLTVILQLGVIYIPALNPIFHTQPLTALELAVCFLLPAVVFVAVEVEKWLHRRGLLYRRREAAAAPAAE